jgi:hypothetical protein
VCGVYIKNFSKKKNLLLPPIKISKLLKIIEIKSKRILLEEYNNVVM